MMFMKRMSINQAEPFEDGKDGVNISRRHSNNNKTTIVEQITTYFVAILEKFFGKMFNDCQHGNGIKQFPFWNLGGEFSGHETVISAGNRFSKQRINADALAYMITQKLKQATILTANIKYAGSFRDVAYCFNHAPFFFSGTERLEIKCSDLSKIKPSGHG